MLVGTFVLLGSKYQKYLMGDYDAQVTNASMQEFCGSNLGITKIFQMSILKIPCTKNLQIIPN